MAPYKPHTHRAQKGDTLAEVLVALLLIALATLLLAAMTTVAGSVNLAAREKDEAFYEAVTQVEAMADSALEPTPGPATPYYASITEDTGAAPGAVPAPAATPEVDVFYADGLALYRNPTT